MQKDPQDSIHDSLSALRRTFFYVLGVSVAIAVLVYGGISRIPGTYEVHFSYMVSMDQREVVPGFKYDGFYGLSAIDLFSTTLARVADSPETVVAAYKNANIKLPTQDAITLVRTIDSEKVAPQLVRFTVRNASKKHAEKLAAGLIVALDSSIDEYNIAGRSSTTLHAVTTPPWTSQNVINPIPVSASFFMLVFVSGNIFVVFREAIKKGSAS